MVRYKLFYFGIIFYIIVIIIYSNYINNIIIINEYILLLNSMKKKLYYYTSKYKNCNYTQTPLYCGHIYEGYKVQKKALHPSNVIVNISKYKQIKIISNVICKNKYIIIGVVCAPDHFLQRLSLRMSYTSYNLILLFFTGLSDTHKINELIKKENDYYHDIIIYDFTTHYFNSSLMLVLELFWIYNNCKNFKYFIYHTPDVFFNYHLFNKVFVNNTYIYPLIAQILKNNRVLRSNRSRFYVPFSIYNETHYPPQPNGPLIVFSLDSIKRIVLNIDRVKMTFWMDDVYLAFLLKEIKIETYNIKNVISLYPVQIKRLPNISIIVNKIMYIHSLPPGSILFLTQYANSYFKPSNYT